MQSISVDAKKFHDSLKYQELIFVKYYELMILDVKDEFHVLERLKLGAWLNMLWISRYRVYFCWKNVSFFWQNLFSPPLFSLLFLLTVVLNCNLLMMCARVLILHAYISIKRQLNFVMQNQTSAIFCCVCNQSEELK